MMTMASSKLCRINRVREESPEQCSYEQRRCLEYLTWPNVNCVNLVHSKGTYREATERPSAKVGREWPVSSFHNARLRDLDTSCHCLGIPISSELISSLRKVGNVSYACSENPVLYHIHVYKRVALHSTMKYQHTEFKYALSVQLICCSCCFGQWYRFLSQYARTTT
jgi:hypothetical protein